MLISFIFVYFNHFGHFLLLWPIALAVYGENRISPLHTPRQLLMTVTVLASWLLLSSLTNNLTLGTWLQTLPRDGVTFLPSVLTVLLVTWKNYNCESIHNRIPALLNLSISINFFEKLWTGIILLHAHPQVVHYNFVKFHHYWLIHLRENALKRYLDRQTDGQTDGQKDGQKDRIITINPPPSKIVLGVDNIKVFQINLNLVYHNLNALPKLCLTKLSKNWNGTYL